MFSSLRSSSGTSPHPFLLEGGGVRGLGGGGKGVCGGAVVVGGGGGGFKPFQKNM